MKRQLSERRPALNASPSSAPSSLQHTPVMDNANIGELPSAMSRDGTWGVEAFFSFDKWSTRLIWRKDGLVDVIGPMNGDGLTTQLDVSSFIFLLDVVPGCGFSGGRWRVYILR